MRSNGRSSEYTEDIWMFGATSPHATVSIAGEYLFTLSDCSHDCKRARCMYGELSQKTERYIDNAVHSHSCVDSYEKNIIYV